METIIYFYRKRGLQEPEIEVRTEAGYTLIRVGFNVEGEKWFGQSIGQTVPEETQAVLDMEEPEMSCKKGILGALRRIGQERRELRRRAEAQQKLEQILLAREGQLKATEKQMRLVAGRLLKRADKRSECRYVCGDNFMRCAAWQVWLDCFPVKEFDGYLQEFWTGQLLPFAVHPRFVILGSFDGIDALIEGCAHRMKALQWILKEREYTQERMDFVEKFCEEYGLAITLRTVPGRAAYRKLRLACPEPANILDFTGEPAVSAAGVAAGSVWLDMLPSEEKRRRLAGRREDIRYVSLEERWKRPEKPLPEEPLKN